jgi:hypothetical protein
LYADKHDAQDGHGHEHDSHKSEEDDKKKKKKKTAESLWDIILKNMNK